MLGRPQEIEGLPQQKTQRGIMELPRRFGAVKARRLARIFSVAAREGGEGDRNSSLVPAGESNIRKTGNPKERGRSQETELRVIPIYDQQSF